MPKLPSLSQFSLPAQHLLSGLTAAIGVLLVALAAAAIGGFHAAAAAAVGATCISINHAVAHGIPDDTRIQPGDMVNIDVSAEREGVFADTGASFIVPPVRPEQEHLCQTTRKALNRAVQAVRTGQKLNAIGRAIEQTANHHGYTVIRNLGSHGVGHSLHEEPGFIPGFYDPRDKRMMQEGMVFTIEPFLSTGAEHADDHDDGWTLITEPGILTAQYEHTLVVTKRGPIVVTL